MDDQQPKIREHTRQSLHLTANVRCGRLSFDCEIVDLSEAGCRLNTRKLHTPVGETVFVKPEGLETLTGKIVWSNEDAIGVEFERPVYRPVVDHLVKYNFTPA